jgi:hypothetical protein
MEHKKKLAPEVSGAEDGGESGGRSFDWTKTISVLLAVAGFVIGLRQYNDQDQRLYRQKIYEERFSLYSELLDLSARLSATPPDSVRTVRFPMMSSEFDRLYFGKMNMIQDTTVERLMKEFKRTKDLFQAGAPDVTPELFQDCSIDAASIDEKGS